MLRATACALFFALVAGTILVPLTHAEDAKKASPELTLASDERAARVLAVFKEEWKAKGLKGEDRVSQRDYAMRKISKIQHPEVVAALGKASRNSDPDTRLIALIYLGDQRALPHLAGQHVLKAMRKNKKDIVLLMTGLQSLGELKYLGASKEIRSLIGNKHWVLRKSAIAAVGQIVDKRLLVDVVRVLGIKLESKGGEDPDITKNKGTKEDGYSWEGAEAVVDRGEADNSKENADAKRIAEAQIARNKAAAQGKGGGGGRGKGGAGRSVKELIPTILRTLKALTGEEFDKPSTIRKWYKDNKKQLLADQKALDEKEKAQKAVTK